MKGYRVKYTLATELVNELVEAADDMVLNKTIARYGRVDLLCIDELGYMELDRRGAPILTASPRPVPGPNRTSADHPQVVRSQTRTTPSLPAVSATGRPWTFVVVTVVIVPS
jgi:hypothetical protein